MILLCTREEDGKTLRKEPDLCANFESGLEERLPELSEGFSEFFFVPYHFQKKMLFVC